MPNFTAGTSFTDGVTNDVTAAKLNALIADAVPTSSLSLNSTTGTISQFSSGTGTAASPAIQPTGDTNTGIFFPAADTIAFSEGGTESMRIDSNGNVGIGTNSPQTPLHIASSSATIRIQDSDTVGNGSNSLAAYVQFRDSSATQIGYVGFGGEANFSLWNQQNSNLLFATNNTERLRIDSSGNVGIGTTTPSAKLDVVGSLGVRVNEDGAGTKVVQLRSNYSSIGPAVQVTTNDPLLFLTNNTERLRIDSSGRVGIGTSSPSELLEVSGSAPKIKISATSNSSVQLLFNSNAGGVQKDTGSIYYLNNEAMTFQTQSTERLRIDSSGNVGIGTTGAVNKLEIVGSFGRGAPVTKTGDFTLADTENWIIVNKGSSCTVTLPAASSWTGREFTIKVITAHTVISASSNIVPRNSATAGTAILAATAGSWATLVSNGTNWVIMCGS